MKTGKGLLEYLEEKNILPSNPHKDSEILRKYILYIRINSEIDPYLLNILNKIVDTTDVDIINLLETEHNNYKNKKDV
jgi:hypothetical protein